MVFAFYSVEGLGNLEGDGVVVEVEVGWVLSHEDVTEDEVVESFWEGHGLNTHEALLLSTGSNLENVVGTSKGIWSIVDGEGQLWHVSDVGAVRFDGDSLDQWVNDGLWTNKEGSSGVDDGLVFGGIDWGFAGLSNGLKLKGPVFLLDDLVGLNDFITLRVHTWHNHVGFGSGIVEIEREGFVGLVGEINEGIELVNGDAFVSKTENTRHLGGEERDTLNVGDFTEAHGGSDTISNSGDILGHGTLDGTRSVGDVESLTVLLVGAGFLGIIEWVSPAWDGPTALGVNPEVGRTGIWDHGELLWWGSDFDIDEVLGVHVVLDVDVLAGEEFLLDGVVLTLNHVFGELLLVECNFTSRGRTDKSGDGSRFHFYYLIIRCLLKNTLFELILIRINSIKIGLSNI